MQDGAKDLCRGRWIDSFSAIFKWRTRKKRARYQQRNLMEYIHNYRCIFHFKKEYKVIIQELKINRHNHENDEKL